MYYINIAVCRFQNIFDVLKNVSKKLKLSKRYICSK